METEKLFINIFGESPISAGIADCGALCNEPAPKVGYADLYEERPSFARIKIAY
jgi:hypothetical protein